MISVIIPAYNAASTLKECVESIIISNSGDVDYEIILVNDGSTDETESICQSLASNYPQVNYLSKFNGGVSAARNYGLKHAKGEYICFVDSDDKVLPEYLSEISRKASNADITFFGFKKHVVSTGNTLTMSPQRIDTLSERNKIEDAMAWLLNNPTANFFGFTWSKIFRANIIKKWGISFNTDLRIKEDEIFTLEYCRHISTLQILEKPLYYYNIFESSLSHSNPYIRYDILMDAYSSLAYQFESKCLKKTLMDISMHYALGYIRKLKREKDLKNEILSQIDELIIPLLAQGYGHNAARWMPAVAKIVPAPLKANAIYYLLR